MKRARIIICLVFTVLVLAAPALADTFGTGDNQFIIDFVPISGSTNPTSGYGIVNNDYRMGTFEITNDQWTKFITAYGTPTGNPFSAYDENTFWTGNNIPTNNVSWYEAAQFVNWLNISNHYQAAYKFTGTQGMSNYTFTPWTVTDTGYNASNPYRNSKAFYFLPTEDEWIKAGYWNGTKLQNYATKAGESLHQGDRITSTGWNYIDNGCGPWDVGSGSEELNGTYNMMGNVREWLESPYYSGRYNSDSDRGLRGGSYNLNTWSYLMSSCRTLCYPSGDHGSIGFRVASVPEPATVVLMLLGGMALLRRNRNA